MAVYTVVRATSFLLNLLCSYVLPIVEAIAFTFTVGCECKAPIKIPCQDHHGNKRKKRKNAEGKESSPGPDRSRGGIDGKWLKLQVNVTLRQVMDSSSQQKGDEGEPASYLIDVDTSKSGFMGRFCGEPGFMIWLLNLPASTVLGLTAKLRKWDDELETLKCSIRDGEEVPLTWSNIRKFISHIFPFNLLGFSNYCPGIGNSPEKPATAAAAIENPRRQSSKRQRQSSTEENTSAGADYSHLDTDNKSGCDEVDIESLSDEDSGTGTKSKTTSARRLASSRSSANTGNEKQKASLTSASKWEDGKGRRNDAIAGDFEVEALSNIGKELDEAANETYDSKMDPDYEPPVNLSSTDVSNYSSGDPESPLSVEPGNTPQSDDMMFEENLLDYHPPAAAGGASGSGTKESDQSRPESIVLLGADSTSPPICEDDYKTPEEEDCEEMGLASKARY